MSVDSYIARFNVSYTEPDGNPCNKESGNFALGVNKSIEIPFGSKDIMVKIEEMSGPRMEWSTIVTKEYPEVVRKKFYLRGTTLQPSYSEDDYDGNI